MHRVYVQPKLYLGSVLTNASSPAVNTNTMENEDSWRKERCENALAWTQYYNCSGANN